MSHAPFIWGAYSIGTIILLWCALAPVIHKQSVIKNIRKLNLASSSCWIFVKREGLMRTCYTNLKTLLFVE